MSQMAHDVENNDDPNPVMSATSGHTAKSINHRANAVGKHSANPHNECPPLGKNRLKP